MQKQLDVERIAKTVLDAVAAPLDALAKRMDALEARPAPVNGKDGIGIADHVTDQSGFLVLTLTDGRSLKTGVKSGEDGKDADPEAIANVVKAEVAAQLPEAVSKIKTVKGDPGPSPDMDEIKGMVHEVVAMLPKPENGKDGAPGCGIAKADINADGELVITYTDGEEKNLGKVVGEKGDAGDEGKPGPEGPEGAKGDDGTSITEALIDKDGNLTLTLSDGTTKHLGKVVGADGKDGFGFEDMEEEVHDDGRVLIRRYRRGAETKEFRHKLSVPLDRGVFKEGQSYERGDAVTWGGSVWIAQGPTDTKPGTNDAWRLAVKRGRDGKDGEKGDPGKDAE